MKKIIINKTGGAVSHCIRATYYKVSIANFLHKEGNAASGVMEIREL